MPRLPATRRTGPGPFPWPAPLLALLATLAAPTPLAAQFRLGQWEVLESQPNVREGGRVDTIAVHPSNDDVLLVASESGGLFRSTDRGLHWQHVDSFPEFATAAVAYLPADPNVVLVTTGDDFRTVPGGGIWRSTDGGGTWTQAAPPPTPPGADRLWASEISIAPDSGTIFVGTSYGVSRSDDLGATWTHFDPFGPGDRRVTSVLAQEGGRVLAAGPSGIRRSSDGGATWLPSTTGAGASIWDMHALGAAPFFPDHAYVVNTNTELYFTEDGGDHWAKIASAPAGGGGCGGITFIRTVGHFTFIPHVPPHRSATLYFGNRCGISRLQAPLPLGSTHFDHSGAWTNLALDHSDTRHLSFDHFNRPLLLGTDGGLHRTTDGGASWTFVGGGAGGYNALQITEVHGQWITADTDRHLYYGTQDNNLYASGDGGGAWINPVCCEGFFLQMLPRVAAEADSRVNFTSCGACSDLTSGDLFTGVTGWPDAQSPPAGNPVFLDASSMIQGVSTAGAFSAGFARTTDRGSHWSQWAVFPDDRRDIPKIHRLPTTRPVVYQPIRTGWYGPGGFEINQLVRVARRVHLPGVSVHYPAMNGFGGLGINPTMFAWYQVFGVDPSDANHLIAPDIVNEKMMQSHDGGENWSDIPALTSLVTGGGSFLFHRWMFPHATVVSFCPDNPSLVAVGTSQGGIFLSADGGTSWAPVPGSERATYITSIDWRSGTEADVSTYGRGLWRLRFRVWLPPHFEEYCRLPCFLDPFFRDMGDPPDWRERLILVLEGTVQGARAEGGVLRQLVVSPGASVAFAGIPRTDAVAAKVRIVESAKTLGFDGFEKPPELKEGALLTGLALTRAGAVGGLLTSAKPMSYNAREDRRAEKEEPEGKQKPPRAGKPTLQLRLGRADGSNRVEPGAPIGISGRDFAPKTTLEIAVDKDVVAKVSVGADGSFKAEVKAPTTFGLHSITVRAAGRDAVIDGVMFLVQHSDQPQKRTVH